MDKKNNNPPRKVYGTSPQFEEENLWDLEDDWEDTEGGQLSEEVLQEDAMEVDEALSVKESESVEEGKDGQDTATEEVAIEERLSFDEAADEVEEEVEEEAENDGGKSVEVSSDVAAHIEPRNKLSLSSTEKIALSTIAVIFLGLTLWGIIWLKQKNSVAANVETLELPIAGEYATVIEFTTFWIAPGDTPGIKLGTVVVPAAKISLGDDSSSGALRIYFRDASQNSVGDPITISFKDGIFNNGTNTIEVSASDGFHLKGDFHAYQMDDSLAWYVEVLEAEVSSSTRVNYKKLFNTQVAPSMR